VRKGRLCPSAEQITDVVVFRAQIGCGSLHDAPIMFGAQCVVLSFRQKEVVNGGQVAPLSGRLLCVNSKLAFFCIDVALIFVGFARRY
jgi:hypothetical protein